MQTVMIMVTSTPDIIPIMIYTTGDKVDWSEKEKLTHQQYLN